MLDALGVEHVDQVLGREVASGARRVGTAPGPAGRGVEAGHAETERRHDVRERRPPRVVKMVGDPLDRDARLDRGARHRLHGGRDRHADRIAEADLVCAEVEEPASDSDGPRRINAAGVWASERGRDVGAPPPPAPRGLLQKRPERAKRGLNRQPDVPFRERVRRCRKDGDRVRARVGRPGEAAGVRHQHWVADAGPSRERRQDLVGVGELGDPVWSHEARRLDLAQAGRHEQLDEAHLGRRRDRRGLVLEAVARSDLVDADARWRDRRGGGDGHASTSSRATSRPRSTRSPAFTNSSATRPALWAATTCSIFIASRVATRSPACTDPPTATCTPRTVPGIGATRSVADSAPADPRGDVVLSRFGGCATWNGTLRPPTETWTTSPALIAGGAGAGSLVAGASGAAAGTAADASSTERSSGPSGPSAARRSLAGAFNRQPPHHRSPSAAPASASAATCQAPSGIEVVATASPASPSSVSVRARPSRTTASRTSRRRNARFVTRPRTSVSSRAPARRRSASARSEPWAMILARSGSKAPPTRSPAAIPASTRIPPWPAGPKAPTPSGHRTATTGPAEGRKPAEGSSAFSRTSTACPPVSRAASTSPWSSPSSASPAPSAIRSWSATRSRPRTSSVTGCSTWSRAFISRKTQLPSSATRNSQVPALS